MPLPKPSVKGGMEIPLVCAACGEEFKDGDKTIRMNVGEYDVDGNSYLWEPMEDEPKPEVHFKCIGSVGKVPDH